MNNQFVKDSLLPDEKILATAKFDRKLMIISILFMIPPFIHWIINKDDRWDGGTAWGVSFPIFLVFFILSFVTIAVNIADAFVITNKRILTKTGIILVSTNEFYIEKIESIAVFQGLIGKIFNFGFLQICGVGATKNLVLFVKSPFEIRQYFYDLKKVSEPSLATPQQPTTPQAPTTEQKYFVQPQSDGKFHIVEKNSITGEFVTIKGEVYDTEFEARKRAKELNAEYNS